MKKMAFVDAINNAWARLVFGEIDVELMNVHLGELYQFIKEEIHPGEFLEITVAKDDETIVGARKLVEETRKRTEEAIAQHNRLKYGTSRGLHI
jgi:hypothetical protein